MLRSLFPAALLAALLLPSPLPAQGAPACREWEPEELRANPTEAELRCRYGATGPGRFGLLSYLDVPVYQPDTPMPGTHIIGVPGHAAPAPGESYEEWEWRMLRAHFGPAARYVHRELELLADDVEPSFRDLEARLRAAGIEARRRETWRAPARQAHLFQQGRSRPGPLATATLTSFHSHVDSLGRPAGRAVDYDVPARQLAAFHAIVREVGLESYGEDSNDQGHVYLRAAEVPETELILLRLLPRVAEVTLATGAPSDAQLAPGAVAALREASRRFASEPFLRRPSGRVARRAPAARIVVLPSPLARRGCGLTPGATPPAPAAGGGAPCGPRRSGAPGGAESGRNTDG